jgi:hypothetical protein
VRFGASFSNSVPSGFRAEGDSVSDLSRRDERTQPGVLTPGVDKKMARPEGAAERVLRCRPRFETNCLSPFSSFVPCSRNYGGQAGCVSRGWIYPWVKTPGSVLLSLRDKSDGPLRDEKLGRCVSAFRLDLTRQQGAGIFAGHNCYRADTVTEEALLITSCGFSPPNDAL